MSSGPSTRARTRATAVSAAAAQEEEAVTATTAAAAARRRKNARATADDPEPPKKRRIEYGPASRRSERLSRRAGGQESSKALRPAPTAVAATVATSAGATCTLDTSDTGATNVRDTHTITTSAVVTYTVATDAIDTHRIATLSGALVPIATPVLDTTPAHTAHAAPLGAPRSAPRSTPRRRPLPLNLPPSTLPRRRRCPAPVDAHTGMTAALESLGLAAQQEAPAVAAGVGLGVAWRTPRGIDEEEEEEDEGENIELVGDEAYASDGDDDADGGAAEEPAEQRRQAIWAEKDDDVRDDPYEYFAHFGRWPAPSAGETDEERARRLARAERVRGHIFHSDRFLRAPGGGTACRQCRTPPPLAPPLSESTAMSSELDESESGSSTACSGSESETSTAVSSPSTVRSAYLPPRDNMAMDVDAARRAPVVTGDAPAIPANLLTHVTPPPTTAHVTPAPLPAHTNMDVLDAYLRSGPPELTPLPPDAPLDDVLAAIGAEVAAVAAAAGAAAAEAAAAQWMSFATRAADAAANARANVGAGTNADSVYHLPTPGATPADTPADTPAATVAFTVPSTALGTPEIPPGDPAPISPPPTCHAQVPLYAPRAVAPPQNYARILGYGEESGMDGVDGTGAGHVAVEERITADDATPEEIVPVPPPITEEQLAEIANALDEWWIGNGGQPGGWVGLFADIQPLNDADLTEVVARGAV